MTPDTSYDKAVEAAGKLSIEENIKQAHLCCESCEISSRQSEVTTAVERWFHGGVAWCRKNPPPEVLALESILKNLKETHNRLGLNQSDKLRRKEIWERVTDALAQFEKATK